MAYREVTDPDEVWEYWEAGLLFERWTGLAEDEYHVPAHGWGTVKEDVCSSRWQEKYSRKWQFFICVED